MNTTHDRPRSWIRSAFTASRELGTHRPGVAVAMPESRVDALVDLSSGELAGQLVALPRAPRSGHRWEIQQLAIAIARLVASVAYEGGGAVVRGLPDAQGAFAPVFAQRLLEHGVRPSRVAVELDERIFDGASLVARLGLHTRHGLATALRVADARGLLAIAGSLLRPSFVCFERAVLPSGAPDVAAAGILGAIASATRAVGARLVLGPLARYADLAGLASAGVAVAHGPVFGQLDHGAPRFTRVALVRAAAHAPPRASTRCAALGVESLEDAVMFTMTALDADPDTRDLVAVTSGWTRLVDEARRTARAARLNRVGSRAAQIVADARFGRAVSACVASLQTGPAIGNLEALDRTADRADRASVHGVEARLELSRAEATRARVAAELDQRMSWLHDALSIRAYERGLPASWADTFFLAAGD